MRIACTFLLAALLAGVAAAPAPAAPYSVWSCRDATGAPLSAAAWIPGGTAGSRSDTCAQGGSLTVALGGGQSLPGDHSGYRFDVPAGVTATRYTAWIAAETAPDPNTAGPYVAGLGQSDPLSTPTVLDGCYNDVSCPMGTFADPLSDANEVSQPVLLGGIGLLAGCASPTDPCDPAADPSARAALFRSVVELDDPSAPTAGVPGGTIAAGGPLSGVRSVVAEVGDAGSGVRTTELLVDGIAADRLEGTGTCTLPYTVADPCPRSLRTAFVLDTAALGEGPHTIAVRAVDAAGNATTGAPLGIVVDHPDLRPDAPATVTLAIAVPKRAGLPVRRAVTGTVVDAGGAPRAGVTVRFEQRPFGAGEDGWRTMRATAVSDATGRFRVPVPRASAQVRALVTSRAYVAPPAVTSFVGRLRASIGASRRKLRNGDRLTLRGRLRNAGKAGAGRTVLIQSRVRGRWRSVDSVETRAGGRIRWRYRFTSTKRTARYRFRFVVPRTKGLPWKRLVTRQVSVLVRSR